MISMELAITDVEAICNGHISCRRLRGVKINPIYQENDNSRNGDGTDTQSDTSVLVGEIQIEMYESLPRHRLVRPSRSAPNLPQSYPTHGYDISSRCDDHGIDSELEHVDDSLQSDAHSPQSTNFSTTVPCDVNEDDVFYNNNEDQRTTKGGRRRNEEQEISHTDKAERGHRKRLTRQSGIDDATPSFQETSEIADSLSSVTESPSSSANSSSTPPKQASTMKRRATPRYFKTRNHQRKRQLSAVQEQGSIIENEQATEADDEETASTELDDNDDDILTVPIHNTKSRSVSNKDADKLLATDETCHNMHFINEKSNSYNIISPAQKEDINEQNTNCNNKINNSSIMDVCILPPKEDILQIPRSKAMYSINTLSSLPSYSHIHYTSPAGSFDYINNNNQTVPDLMLQHNGPMNGVSKNSVLNGFVKQGSGYEVDEYISWDAHDLAAMYSLSNTSSQDSDKSLCKDVTITDCECGGRPTLKCSCGREALQKLLSDKYIIKCNQEYCLDNNCNSVTEEVTSVKSVITPTKGYTPRDKPTVDGRLAKRTEIEIFEITESPSNKSQEKKVILPLKSILHNSLSPNRTISALVHRCVTFSQDTIFNENKGVIYLKECISPSDLALLITELKNRDDDELDNPAFEEFKDDDKHMTDSKEKKKSKKRTKSKNKIATNDPLTLKASELNAPEYMQHYLNGMNGCDVVRTSPLSNGKKAPPVSIEAIGGTIIDDPSCDEIGIACDDDFEEYRKRRKLKYGEDDENVDKWLKKTSRKKKIKICAIVITVISLVITGIALAIHFGAPHVGSVTTGLPSGGGNYPGVLL